MEREKKEKKLTWEKITSSVQDQGQWREFTEAFCTNSDMSYELNCDLLTCTGTGIYSNYAII